MEQDQRPDVYRSTKTWVDLNPPAGLLRNIELKGWANPTLIQGVAIPKIMEGRNLIAQSKNGTGKTGAFVVGILMKCDPNVGGLQAICMSHTRELNMQNYSVFNELSQNTELIAGILQKGDRELPRAHIVCSTLGTLVNVLKSADPGLLSFIKFLVYDEADVLFDSDSNSKLISAIKQKIPQKGYQQLLFSATFDPKVMEFIQNEIDEPFEYRIKQKDLSLDNVLQFVVQCEHNHKFDLVYDLIRHTTEMTCCLVFCNDTKYLDRLHESLRKRGYTAHVLAAQRQSPEVRDQVINKLKAGEIKVLLTTNLTSRGIDARLVNMVINIDPPVTREYKPDPITYIHRVGRTGRYGRKGIALNIVSDNISQSSFVAIQSYYSTKFTAITPDELPQYLEQVNKDYENQVKANEI